MNHIIPIEMFLLYRALIAFGSQVVPKFAVVGIQGAGKSSLIELLVQFPIGYTQRATATRCPVRYELRHSDGGVSASVNGVPCEMEEIAGIVGGEMEALRDNPDPEQQFSVDPICVVVESPDVPNLVLYDLPGVIPNPDPEQEVSAACVETILQTFTEDESFTFITVVKCTEALETIPDRQILERAAGSSGWMADSITVVNKFNMVAPMVATVDDANAFFSDVRGVPNTYLVALKPDDDFHRDSASVDEAVVKLRTHPEEEQTWFEGWKTNLGGAAGAWDPQNESVFGTHHVCHAILRRWVANFTSEFPAIRRELSAARISAEHRVALLRGQMRLADVPALVKCYMCFADRYMDALEMYMKGVSESDRFGRTYMEDVDNAAPLQVEAPVWECVPEWMRHLVKPWVLSPQSSESWIHYLTPAQLGSPGHMGGEGQMCGQDLECAFSGMKAVERVLGAFYHMMLCCRITEERYSDDQIKNVGAQKGGGFDTETVVLWMAKGMAEEASGGIDWLMEVLAGVASQCIGFAEWYVTASNEFGVIASHAEFLGAVRDASTQAIHRHLAYIACRFREEVEIRKNDMRVDGTSRKIVGLMVNPLEKNSYDPSMENPPPSPAGASSIPRQGYYVAQAPRPSHVPDGRIAAKAARILEERQRLCVLGNEFNTADMVEPQFPALKAINVQDIDFKYLRAAALELHVNLIHDVFLTLSGLVKTHFLLFLGQDTHGSLRTSIKDIPAGYSEDEILFAAGIDLPALQDELVSAEERLNDARDIEERMVGTASQFSRLGRGGGGGTQG